MHSNYAFWVEIYNDFSTLLFNDSKKWNYLSLACKEAIKKDMLSSEEIEWFNQYHQRVFDSVKDLISPELRYWLAQKTASI